jgi:transcriptional regulator GlxA family with amidase domain
VKAADSSPPTGGGTQRQVGRKGGPTHRPSAPRRNAVRLSGPSRSTIAFPQTKSPLGVTDRRIEAAIALIENGLEAGVSISKLAASVGLSRFRLEHLFKTQVRIPIRAYVEARRVTRAKTLLRDLGLSIKEVATRCGYASTSSLTREFRRKLGLSPSDWRHSTPG